MFKITDDIEGLLDSYYYKNEEKVKGTPYTRSHIRLNLLIINPPSPIILDANIVNYIAQGADTLQLVLNNTSIFEIDIMRYPFSIYNNKLYPFHYQYNDTVLEKLGCISISIVKDGLLKYTQKLGNTRKGINSVNIIKTWDGHICKLIVMDEYVNLLVY